MTDAGTAAELGHPGTVARVLDPLARCDQPGEQPAAVLGRPGRADRFGPRRHRPGEPAHRLVGGDGHGGAVAVVVELGQRVLQQGQAGRLGADVGDEVGHQAGFEAHADPRRGCGDRPFELDRVSAG